MSIYKHERGLVSGRKSGGTEMILVQVFAELLYNASSSFIVGGFLKPHLHSWPLVSPLPSFVHLSTSKQKPWVHAVLERHLVDTFKAFRLYNLSFCCCYFQGLFYDFMLLHTFISGKFGISFLACFSSFHSSHLLKSILNPSPRQMWCIIFAQTKACDWHFMLAMMNYKHSFCPDIHLSVLLHSLKCELLTLVLSKAFVH